MNDKLISIFKKAVNGDATIKSDVVDYLVNNGGTVTGHAVVDCFHQQSTIFVGVDGNYVLSLKVYCEVAYFLAKGKKIQAIKALYAATGLGLKEAKDAVDNTKNWPMPKE